MRTQIRRQREWLPPANPVNVTGQCVIETQNHVCYDAGNISIYQYI